MLHRNHFPNFFVLTLLQIAAQFSYHDAEALKGFERRLQEEVSDDHAELGAVITGIRDALIAEMRESAAASPPRRK